MKMGYFFLGLLLCVSGDVLCMKRSATHGDSAHAIDRRDSEEQGIAKRQRHTLDVDFLSEYEDEREIDKTSESDFKESSDSQSSAAVAMEVCSEGEDDNLFSEPSFEALEIKLHTAIQSNSDARVREALEEGANVLARDTFINGDTALHCAVRIYVNHTIVQQLLEAMADVEALNYDLLTPILVAAEAVNRSAITLLMGAQADPRVVDDRTNETVLHKLLRSKCNLSLLREMICEYGVDMRARDYAGNTPAFTAFGHSHIDEGLYVARMKYKGQRIYNFLRKKYKTKVRSAVDSALVANSTEVPSALVGIMVDYI